MHILFLTLAYPLTDHNLYTDLLDGFLERDHTVTVIRHDETKNRGPISLYNWNNVCVLTVPTGKLFKTNFIIKGINTVLLERRFLKRLKQINFDHIDVVLYSTPPITFQKVVTSLKRKYKSITYLLLKDIFPQNAVDMGMFKRKSILYAFFRYKEKKLYRNSDIIGCMSPANVNYLYVHNPELRSKKLNVIPNCIFPMKVNVIHNKFEIFNKYGIPSESIKLVYGGNLGKPQGIDFLINCIEELKNDSSIFTVIVGEGTEYNKLSQGIKHKGIKNTKLINFLPKKQYFELLFCIDIGLIFLDHRFTIPNFPSRVLDYMNFSKPILACTDVHCDIKQEICDQGAGFWCESNDIKAFKRIIENIKDNKDEICYSMGKRSRELLIEKYSVSKVVSKMLMEIDETKQYKQVKGFV
jgi:glycosyltransferase involved in cell wall biosynthesis